MARKKEECVYINSTFRCSFVGDAWMLEERREIVSKDKNTRMDWAFVGYYGQVEHIFNICIDRGFNIKKDLNELREFIKEIRDGIEKVLITGKERVLIKEKTVKEVEEHLYECFPGDKRKKPKLIKKIIKDSKGNIIKEVVCDKKKMELF